MDSKIEWTGRRVATLVVATALVAGFVAWKATAGGSGERRDAPPVPDVVEERPAPIGREILFRGTKSAAPFDVHDVEGKPEPLPEDAASAMFSSSKSGMPIGPRDVAGTGQSAGK